MACDVANGGDGVLHERELLHSRMKAEIARELTAALDFLLIVAQAVNRAESLHSFHCLEGAMEDAMEGNPRVFTEEARGEMRDGRTPFY